MNPSEDDCLKRFIDLTKIAGRSGEEAAVAESIKAQLRDAGLDESAIVHDDANSKSRIGGNCGNLIVKLSGDDGLPRVLLSAHMDTVPVCLGAEPVVMQDDQLGQIVTSSADTGLGADDRAGCAVVLSAILERLKREQQNPADSFPPAVAIFLIQEEIGLVGARHLDAGLVGPVDLAFNFDGGEMDTVRHGAIGGERMQAKIYGFASHAGVAPEKGVSAIVIAAKAIARLADRGLLGKIEIDGRRGTANVGVIEGGEATNVVTPEVSLRIEARSHDAEFRTWVVGQIQAELEQAAADTTDILGRCGKVDFLTHVDYEAFVLPEDHSSVRSAWDRLTALGYEPNCEVADGGLDANWLYQHGIEAVTLGCGQSDIHTVDEKLLVDHYLAACRFAAAVVCGE